MTIIPPELSTAQLVHLFAELSATRRSRPEILDPTYLIPKEWQLEDELYETLLVRIRAAIAEGDK